MESLFIPLAKLIYHQKPLNFLVSNLSSISQYIINRQMNMNMEFYTRIKNRLSKFWTFAKMPNPLMFYPPNTFCALIHQSFYCQSFVLYGISLHFYLPFWITPVSQTFTFYPPCILFVFAGKCQSSELTISYLWLDLQ